MPLDFPSSPSVNDIYTYDGKTWIWNGSAWLALATAINNTAIGDVTPNTGAFTTLSSTGNTTLGNIDSNLIPAANVTYNLGSNVARWNDIWLANSTIHIGDANISSDGANLLLPTTIEVGNAAITESGGNLVFPPNTTVGGGTSITVPKVTSLQITNSSWTVLDDTAISLSGGYFILNGSGFESGSTVYVEGTQVTSVSFISSSLLRCQVGARTAGTYNVYVVNPNTTVAILANGLTYSSSPTWVTGSTLPNQQVDISIALELVATGATSYSLQSGSTLPSGVTLSSGGLLSGTVTGIVDDTIYSFTVEAIDNEFQESPRTFSMTVTVPVSKLWAWGLNQQGELGLGDTDNRSSPTQVGKAQDWNRISGTTFKFATKTGGTLWSWGANGAGQLGLNDRIDRSSPTQVGAATDWGGSLAVAPLGGTFFAGVKSTGTLWMWGSNSNGVLGLGTTIARSSPTQIGTATDWRSVSMSNINTLAVKTGNTLWAWGSNSNGQLGLNTTISRSSPVQVGTLTDWSTVASGLAAVAVKTGGSIWSWGSNSNGQLGLNTTISRSSPVQIGSLTGWTAATSDNSGGVLAIRSGALWGWGYNINGNLGLNDRVNRSSPVQVGADTNWSKIAAITTTVIAVKTNGTLWMWGQNSNGSLGLNDTISRSSPVQIGVATDWNIGFTGSSTGAVKV